MRRLIMLLSPVAVLFAGCGTSPMACTPKAFGLSVYSPLLGPSTMYTATHGVPPPGDAISLVAEAGALSGPGCATPQIVRPAAAKWTVSDTAHVQLSAAADGYTEIATCIGATTQPAQVTATVVQPPITETASTMLSCK